jgi:hypothetical protein
MLIIISPAKSLDFKSPIKYQKFSEPIFCKESKKLAMELKKFSATSLESLMGISKKLAELNFTRFQNFDKAQTRQALLAFDGDVYEKIDKTKFTEQDFVFAQNNLRILSGLYGILRPLDLIKPHRLEMGTSFKKFKFINENLYNFWGNKIKQELENHASKTIINLASEEYFSAINSKKITKKIINIFFKERKNNQLKTIAINSKKARGAMTNFVIKNKITDFQKLKNFCEENYCFEESLSNQENYVFIR